MDTLIDFSKDFAKGRFLMCELLEQEPLELFYDTIQEYFPFIETEEDISELERRVAALYVEPRKAKIRFLGKIFRELVEGMPSEVDINNIVSFQQLAIKYLKNGQYEKIEPVIDQMLFSQPGNLSVLVFRALMSQYIQRHKRRPRLLSSGPLKRIGDIKFTNDLLKQLTMGWRGALGAIVSHPDKYSLELLCESSQPVYELTDISNIFTGSLLVKCLSYEDYWVNLGPSASALKDFIVGLDYLSLAKEIIKDHPEFGLPIIINFFDDWELSFPYIMIRSKGETLQQRILAQSETLEQDLLQISNYLAFLHVNLPVDKSKKGNVRIAWKTRAKLTNKDLTANREIARGIMHNYRPVFNAFQDAIWVVNKDGHPEQWLISEDEEYVITALDWDDKGIVPIQFDLANLLEYAGNLSDELKYKVIDAYIGSYNKYAGKEVIEDRRQFKLVYWNAVIQRAISLCSAWSSPKRSSLHPRRRELANRALHAIGKIKQEFPEYYTHDEYRKNYLTIYCKLRELREEVKDPFAELASLIESLAKEGKQPNQKE